MSHDKCMRVLLQLCLFLVPPTGPVCKVHIYTDGSFKESEGEAADEAAWAFPVILEHTEAVAEEQRSGQHLGELGKKKK